MTHKYRLAEQLSITEVDDEVVLLKLDTGLYYGLNQIGAQFITGIQQSHSVHQICSTIAEQYQMPYHAVNGDLDELISQLLDQQLIEAIESA